MPIDHRIRPNRWISDLPPVSTRQNVNASIDADSAGGYISIPGTRVMLIRPDGFTKTDRFLGFMQESTNASIMITEMDGPYAEVTAGFDGPQMQSRGMRLLQKEDLTVDGWAGMLLRIEQDAHGITFAKWLLVFGDETQTVMITATYPKELEQELGTMLHDAVVSAKFDADRHVDPFADLPFSIGAAQNLQFAKRMGNMLMCTSDGVMPIQTPQDPLFVVGYAVSDINVADQMKFAEERLVHTALISDAQTLKNEPITIDGLSGSEIEATARHSESGTPVLVYQVILFDGETYIIMQGRCGVGMQSKYLPAFKTLAKSVRRK